MSDKETAMVASKLSSDIKFEEANKSKGFYQHFTYYFIAILLILTCSISVSLLYFYQHNKQTQVVINEQLAPLQTQFLQQVYLIKANKLIDELLQNFDAQHFITLQQNLSLQSKKLTLLESTHNKSYQQWFNDNNAASDLLTRIASSHARNKTLKNNALIQIDTLLDAIEIQLKKQDSHVETVDLLRKVQSDLSTIVTMLQRLNLQTSLGAFEQLKAHIDGMFVADYGKMLANQRDNDLAMEEIVRDFIRFEDLVLKRGLLAKWQGQLRLMDGYQQQLVVQQQGLQSILDGVSERAEHSDALMRTSVKGNKSLLDKQSKPIWLWLTFFISLLSTSLLLWIIRLRLKAASQFAVEYISCALDGVELLPLEIGKSGFISKQSKAFFCSESWQLLEKVQHVNDSRYTEAEHFSLIQENETLAAITIKDEAKLAQLTLELELLEFNASAKSKSQILLEQQRCKTLHEAAIKQLVLLGCSGVHGSGFEKADDFVYHAHIQARDLVRKLRQARCYRYLQTADAILTLADINVIAQLQAILLNLEGKFLASGNSIQLNIDDKILPLVNVDVELFTELLRVFISLLTSKQIQKRLLINLQLVDKNSGQQKICFSGEMLGEEEIEQLPCSLKGFTDASSEQSDLAEYFNTLLNYQHGEDVCVNLTEQGYQLSFTLPLAVTNTIHQQSYPVLALPGPLAALEQVTDKLVTKYKPMPIEVLVAVNAPIQYQRLQQLLKAMGLQVTFATNEFILEKQWHSGRFAVLITELTCNPFISFLGDELFENKEKMALPRGVFTLGASLEAFEKESDFSHWNQGQLTADSSIDELISAISPWLKEKTNAIHLSGKARQDNTHDESNYSASTGDNSALASITITQSFNFERYIKHQGSAELALYMLEEYTNDNSYLVERLSKAFTHNEADSAKAIINALTVNAKILAADDLLKACQQWREIVNSEGIDSTNKCQIRVLHDIKMAIKAVNLHAESVA